MSPYKILLVLHVIAGCIALSTFWVAALSRKGSPLHKAVGKAYLIAMCGILATGFPMGVYAMVYFNVAVGAFLMYLLIITGSAMWTSWRAVKDKRDVRAFKGRMYRMLMVLNAVSGLAMIYVGLVHGGEMRVIITAFSFIGIFAAIGSWRFLRRTEHEPKWWMREHINGMLGNAVATHIAFLQIGLPKILPMIAGPTQQTLAWLGPLAITFVAGAYLTRKYIGSKHATASR